MLTIGSVGPMNCRSTRGVRPLGINNRNQSRLFSKTFHTGQRIDCPAPRPARSQRHARKISAQAGDPTAEEKFRESFTDQFKEQSRKYRRTVFGFSEWQRHRSSKRYWRHIMGLVQSRIVWGLAWPIAFVKAVALAVCLYEEARMRKILPPFFPSVCTFPSQPFNTASFALSLLLVFRTNASYARWAEARKIWGGVLNRTRDITRQCLTWFRHEEHELRAMIVRWVTAFPKALLCHVREENDIRQELKGILRPAEIDCVCAATHRPNYVLNVISELIKRSGSPPTEVYRMDENLTFFADSTGACERILKTPIPLSYTRHTSRFLIMWLTILPLTLYSSCLWATIPWAGIIAFLLLGIEEIGVQIEEPFSILPLEAICTTSQNNLREMELTSAGITELVTESLGTAKPVVYERQADKNGKSDWSFLSIAGGRSGSSFRASSYLSGMAARPVDDGDDM